MNQTERRLTEALSAEAEQVRTEDLRPLSAPARQHGLLRWLAPAAAAAAVSLVVSLTTLLPHLPHRHPRSHGTVPLVVRLDRTLNQVEAMTADPASGTMYLPGFALDRRGVQGVLALIDLRSCNVSARSSCAVTRIATGARLIRAIAVNSRTRTLYEISTVPGKGSSSLTEVSALDAARCDARQTAGCSTPIGAWPLAGRAQGHGFLAVNEATGTVYAQYADQLTAAYVAEISGKRPSLIHLGGGGFAMALDQATNTLYVSSGDSVAVIDAASCDSRTTSGCGRAPQFFSIGGYATGIAVDDANHTIYVSRDGGLVAVVDRNTCDAAVTSGCGRQALIPVGASPFGNPVLGPSGTLYVLNQKSGTVSMIDTRTCAAADAAGCGSPPVFPVSVGIGPALLYEPAHTLYVLEGGRRAALALINSRSCTVADTAGCPRAAVPRWTTVNEQVCSPAVLPATSGEPIIQGTGNMTQVASGIVGGELWTLWARRGEPMPQALEDGGMVLNSRWYGLCTGYQNPAEMELINAGVHGVAYGLISFGFRVKVRLTFGQSQLYPRAVRMRGASFFVTTVPRPACTYPAVTLRASYLSRASTGHWAYEGFAWHQLDFGSCHANRVVAITGENGNAGTGGHFVP